MTERNARLEKKIADAQEELEEAQKKLTKLRLQLPPEPAYKGR